MLILIITMVLISYMIGFLIGKYTERFQWNKLIKSGKIQKPNNHKRYDSDYWANN